MPGIGLDHWREPADLWELSRAVNLTRQIGKEAIAAGTAGLPRREMNEMGEHEDPQDRKISA
jgi:hypothetical protein